METIQRFLLMFLSVLVLAMPVYAQDSKESKGSSRADKADSKDKNPKEKADSAGTRGASKDKELDRGCGGGIKP